MCFSEEDRTVPSCSIPVLKTKNSIPRISKSNNSSRRIQKLVNSVFAGLACLIVVGATIGLFKLFLFHNSPCNFNNGPTEYQLLECEKYQSGVSCSFLVTHCSDKCPVGFVSDDFGCPISCVCALTGIFESDVMFNPITLPTILTDYANEEDTSLFVPIQSISKHFNLWKEYIVSNRIRIPYVFSRSILEQMNNVEIYANRNTENRYNEETTSNALLGMFESLSFQTCVDFYPRSDEPSFVEFTNTRKLCCSYIGRLGGRQEVNIADSCVTNGSILHQFMHVLGFWHEHSRYDRNDYVQVLQQNVKQGFLHNFQQRGRANPKHRDFPYDKNSITHFDGLDFSSNQFPTLISQLSRETITAQRSWLSKLDVAKIKEIYCKKRTPTRAQGPCLDCTAFQSGDIWSKWSKWSVCSSSCGSGQSVRVRRCVNEKGNEVYYGRCKGSHFESRLCESIPCKQGIWGTWSHCSVTCGTGRIVRESCCGSKAEYEEKNCHLAPCNVTRTVGMWTKWGEWSDCPQNCVGGLQQRYRRCSDKSNATVRRSKCPIGLPGVVEFRKCQESFCSINDKELGNWGLWSKWSLCSVSCGSGTISRSRLCMKTNASISQEDRLCIKRYSGKNVDVQAEKCSVQACNYTNIPMQRMKKRVEGFPERADVSWSDWSSWGSCTMTCKAGKRYRTRKCLGYSSDGCLGPTRDADLCSVIPCDSASKNFWTSWTDWTECSSWCQGTRWRKRLFHCGSPSSCRSLPYVDVIRCNEECEDPKVNISATKLTKKPFNWGGWSMWSDCTNPCDGGVHWRRRDCVFGKPGSRGCFGSAYSIEPCNDHTCTSLYNLWASWGEWSVCSANCFGIRTRRRSYTCIPNTHCSTAPSIDIEPCNTVCSETNDVDKSNQATILDEESLAMGFLPNWSDWSTWVRCTKRCGGGIEWRKRDCLFGDAGHDGCGGEAYETRSCNTHDCLPIWNQTTIFCDHFLQVVDYNGDGLADLICVYDQNIAPKSKPTTLNKMKVAINMKNGTFDIKMIEFEAVLHESLCNKARSTLKHLKTSINLKKTESNQFSNDIGANLSGFEIANHFDSPVQRRANKGFCYESSDGPIYEMVSILGQFLHLFCYDQNGRLQRVFFNVSSTNALFA